MQFLGFPPRAAVAIFAEVFHHQSHIFQMAHARLPVPKPETLRMAAHQGRRARAQLQRRRRGRRQLAEFIGFGVHGGKLENRGSRGKPPCHRNAEVSTAAPPRSTNGRRCPLMASSVSFGATVRRLARPGGTGTGLAQPLKSESGFTATSGTANQASHQSIDVNASANRSSISRTSACTSSGRMPAAIR